MRDLDIQGVRFSTDHPSALPAFFRDNPAVQRGETSIAMKKPEPLMLNFVAAEVFKFSFKDTWRLLDLDERKDKGRKKESSGRLKKLQDITE